MVGVERGPSDAEQRARQEAWRARGEERVAEEARRRDARIAEVEAERRRQESEVLALWLRRSDKGRKQGGKGSGEAERGK